MSKPALLMTGAMMPLIENGCDAAFTVHRLHKAADREALLKQVAPEISAICTGGHTGVKTDDALMGRFPNLKIVGNFGVGYDSVEVAAAARRGVVVTNTPEVLTEEVADTTLGLLLGTVREFYQAEKWLRDGRWAPEGDYRLTPASLRDRSVGIAGLGRIGKAIGRRLEAFGLPVSYFGRSKQADVSYKFYNDLVAMARDVDTLIVVTPGGPGTQNLINAAVLECARAPRHPDQHVAGIGGGRAGTDRCAQEADHPFGRPRRVCRGAEGQPALLELDNVTMFPHVGSASVHTRDAMGQLVVDNLVAFTQGRPPKTPVPETPFKGW